MSTARIRQHGISLIEAVVALAVMAFGLLGVVGLQTSLRANADVSKQRSEAVRIAQQDIEQQRRFSVIASTPGRFAFDDIISGTPPPIPGTNATYTLTRTVVANTDPRHKTLTANVAWADRAGTTQSISLSTVIVAAGPELSAALAVPGIGAVVQGKNNPLLPPGARDLGNGTSEYTPPGQDFTGGARWIFDNATGVIYNCATPPCSDLALLLSGFILFSTDATAPGPAEAAAPLSDAFLVDVTAYPTTPAPATPVTCFTGLQSVVSPATPKYVAYACLMPILSAQPWWSGASTGSTLLGGSALTPFLATSSADPTASRFRVCRYTQDARTRIPSGTGTPQHSTVPPLTNQQHPLGYVHVDASLQNQNFLVIRAGDGANAFDCPDDLVTSPNRINTNTWHHQPST